MLRLSRPAARGSRPPTPRRSLLVWGTDDRVVRPRHSRDLTAAFPQADVVLLDGMGHHPVHERREDVLALLRTGRAARRAKRGSRGSRRRIFQLPTFRPTPRFA